MPIGPGTQRVKSRTSTEIPPSSCSEIRKTLPCSVRYTLDWAMNLQDNRFSALACGNGARAQSTRARYSET